MNSEDAYLKLIHIKKVYNDSYDPEFISELKSIILRNPKYCYLYLNKYDDLPHGEKIISSSSEWSYFYARDIIHGRFTLGEDIISSSSEWSYFYARDIIHGRFILGENIISSSSEHSYLYARDIIHGPWEKGELAISKNHRYSILYIQEITQKPLHLIHPEIFQSKHKKLYLDFLNKYNYHHIIQEYAEWII